MQYSISYYSSKGGREKNEDSYSVIESSDNILAIVADGLGGYADGEVASKTVIQCLNMTLSHEKISKSLLVETIEKANEQIVENDPTNRMKSTVAALWFDSQKALAAHVGDTRIYQFRNGEIIYQSRDHSLCQMKVALGEIGIDDIRGNKDRNKLTRALGVKEDVSVELKERNVLCGDTFLLCSDGFWEYVWEDEMKFLLLETENVREWLKAMQRLLENRVDDTNDNHTAIAISIEE